MTSVCTSCGNKFHNSIIHYVERASCGLFQTCFPNNIIAHPLVLVLWEIWNSLTMEMQAVKTQIFSMECTRHPVIPLAGAFTTNGEHNGWHRLYRTCPTDEDFASQSDSGPSTGMDSHRKGFNKGPFFKGDVIWKPATTTNTGNIYKKGCKQLQSKTNGLMILTIKYANG